MQLRSLLLTTALGLAGMAAVPAQAETPIQISLKERYLTLLDDGKVIGKYPVAIGAPESPTPAGRYAVTKIGSAAEVSQERQGHCPRPEQSGGRALRDLCADRHG